MGDPMDDPAATRREIWDGETFRGFSASFNQLCMIDDLLRTCSMPETEVLYWTAYAENLTEDQANNLIRRLQENQRESSDPAKQFLDRIKNMR
jgi:hypothetical protein